MSRRAKLFVSLGVVVGAIGYLVSQSVGEQVVYSKYVDELMNERARYVGRPVRVEGVVEDGSIENQRGTLDYRFRVVKGGQVLPVRYNGIVPDTFRDGAGVTVAGRLTQAGYFHAEEVIAKCPSKYEMREKQAAGQPVPHAMPPRPFDPIQN